MGMKILPLSTLAVSGEVIDDSIPSHRTAIHLAGQGMYKEAAQMFEKLTISDPKVSSFINHAVSCMDVAQRSGYYKLTATKRDDFLRSARRSLEKCFEVSRGKEKDHCEEKLSVLEENIKIMEGERKIESRYQQDQAEPGLSFESLKRSAKRKPPWVYGDPPLKIAVCVSGMLERLQPSHILSKFVEPNDKKEAFQIDVVYAIANASQLYYSTHGSVTYSKTEFAVENEDIFSLKLMALTRSKVFVLPRTSARSRDEWKSWLELDATQKMDRIAQYSGIIDKIFDMYSHQNDCVSALRSIEKFYGEPYDYIVSTREDVFPLKPIDLSLLLSARTLDGELCDIIVKDCLSWGGLNMRFQLLRRSKAFEFLGGRFAFYKESYIKNKTYVNPEIFELAQAENLGLKICPVSIDVLPVVVARHTYDGKFCFIPPEIEFSRTDKKIEEQMHGRLCIPHDTTDFVNYHRCK
eukprot:UC4_evm1s607